MVADPQPTHDAPQSIQLGAKRIRLVVTAELQLSGDRPDLGLHAVWEIACRPENHPEFGDGLLKSLTERCHADDFAVAAHAAAT